MRLFSRNLILPLFFLATLGCSSAGGTENADPNQGAGGESSGAGGTEAGGSDAGSGGSSVAVGGSNGSGGNGAGGFQGCYNVDVLFAIDNSGSMGDKQQALIKAFPGFAQTMKEKLSGAVTYHVGVVTSDDPFSNVAGCQSIGDLIVKTGGPESSNKDCGPFPGGKHYLDGADAQLSSRFQCIAQVGAGGNDNERLMRGLLNAVNPTRNAAGACNEGFARPDSLLILVLIGDEDDAPDGACDPLSTDCQTGSGGTSTDWFNELVSYRGGVADNIVALSLVNNKGTCAGSIGARLKGFTLKFKNSAVGDVCSLDYAKFFDEALPIIGNACEKYTPIK